MLWGEPAGEVGDESTCGVSVVELVGALEVSVDGFEELARLPDRFTARLEGFAVSGREVGLGAIAIFP